MSRRRRERRSDESPPIDKLTPEQRAAFRKALFANAASLLIDAAALLKRGSTGHAFALATLGTEELSKVIPLRLPDHVDFAKIPPQALSQLFSNHSAKLIFGLVAEPFLEEAAFNPATLPQVPDLESLRDTLDTQARDLNIQKQNGLYVSFGDDTFHTPNEAITVDAAETALFRLLKAVLLYWMADTMIFHPLQGDEDFQVRLDRSKKDFDELMRPFLEFMGSKPHDEST